MCMCILRITIAIWSQDRGSFFDSRDGCRRQVAWSEIVNHRVWHVSWPYSPSNILTVSQFAIMHFRSLCVSDTHSLESARAKWISIVANERAKAEYRETQKWSRLQWWRRQDGTMFRAIEKSCESGTRQRMCKRMPKNLYLLRIHIPILLSVGEDFIYSRIYFLGVLLYDREFIIKSHSQILLQFTLIDHNILLTS